MKWPQKQKCGRGVRRGSWGLLRPSGHSQALKRWRGPRLGVERGGWGASDGGGLGEQGWSRASTQPLLEVAGCQSTEFTALPELREPRGAPPDVKEEESHPKCWGVPQSACPAAVEGATAWAGGAGGLPSLTRFLTSAESPYEGPLLNCVELIAGGCGGRGTGRTDRRAGGRAGGVRGPRAPPPPLIGAGAHVLIRPRGLGFQRPPAS